MAPCMHETNSGNKIKCDPTLQEIVNTFMEPMGGQMPHAPAGRANSRDETKMGDGNENTGIIADQSL